jgi:hypothetical protein
MTPFPSEPVDRHARFIAAFCEDLASADYRRGGRTPRADGAAAIRPIERSVAIRRPGA